MSYGDFIKSPPSPSDNKWVCIYARFVKFVNDHKCDSEWCRGFCLAFLDKSDNILEGCLKLAKANDDTTKDALLYVEMSYPDVDLVPTKARVKFTY